MTCGQNFHDLILDYSSLSKEQTTFNTNSTYIGEQDRLFQIPGAWAHLVKRKEKENTKGTASLELPA